MRFFESVSARVNRIVAWADRLQRRHGWLGFPYAVIKKYGDDDGGREAALITYYGFLSIFPLLLLAVAVLSRVLADNPELRQRLITEIVPTALRSTVENSATALPASTLPFVAGLIGLLFSGTGVVFSAYQTLNHVAAVPRRPRAGFASRYVRCSWCWRCCCWGHWQPGGSLWWSRRCPACREQNAPWQCSGRPWSSSQSCCAAPGCC